jgi:hypothetical protein
VHCLVRSNLPAHGIRNGVQAAHQPRPQHHARRMWVTRGDAKGEGVARKSRLCDLRAGRQRR